MNMKTMTRLSLSVATLMAVAGMMSGSAFAQTSASGAASNPTQWQKDHPRRTEVNDRIKNQDRRINAEEKDGQITKAQAHQLKSNDRAIHQEEKDMAKQDHGHITKQEQRTLNQQLNKNSKEIGK
jgi:Skp family chaperone for outer membrane proteins